MQTPDSVKEILSCISYPGYQFNLNITAGRMYLQLSFLAKCAVSGHEEIQKSRKWYISPHKTKSEICQTAFKAVITAVEHEIRENFHYQGVPVYGPHFNVDDLLELAQREKDVRPKIEE